MPTRKKNKRWCFVPGCNTGYYKSSAAEKVLLFRAPTRRELFDKWTRAIPRADNQLDENSAVCEKHFGSRLLWVTRSAQTRPCPSACLCAVQRSKAPSTAAAQEAVLCTVRGRQSGQQRRKRVHLADSRARSSSTRTAPRWIVLSGYAMSTVLPSRFNRTW